MKGGIVYTATLNGKFTPASYNDAITYFMNNSEFKILTNNSISCITFLATIDNIQNSPFIHSRVRNENINIERVNQLLFKLFPTADEPSELITGEIDRGPTYGYIQISTYNNVLQEALTQLRIHDTTYLRNNIFCQPICPFIVNVANSGEETKESFIQIIIDRLIPRNGRDLENEITDINGTLGINNDNVTMLSRIVMEFGDGFDTYDNHLKGDFSNEQKQLYSSYINYYRHILNIDLGLSHNDLHKGNAMINIQTQSVFLIDFGTTVQYNGNKEISFNDYEGSYNEDYFINLERERTQRMIQHFDNPDDFFTLLNNTIVPVLRMVHPQQTNLIQIGNLQVQPQQASAEIAASQESSPTKGEAKGFPGGSNESNQEEDFENYFTLFSKQLKYLKKKLFEQLKSRKNKYTVRRKNNSTVRRKNNSTVRRKNNSTLSRKNNYTVSKIRNRDYSKLNRMIVV